MPLTANNREIDNNKKIYELIPWPGDMHFEDNLSEANREPIYVKFARPYAEKFSLTGSAAEMCSTDSGATNHLNK
jgi:hypothetical protein